VKGERVRKHDTGRNALSVSHPFTLTRSPALFLLDRCMDIAPVDLARVRELYTRGHYRQAYEVAVALGPLRSWSGTAARLIGGRLAIQLGAPKLGRRMHLVAFRTTPAHPEAIYYHARYRMERFGPLSTWRFMRDHPDWSDAPPELHTDWVSLSGFIAARLRDFDRAERLLNRAEAITPDRPWPCIERSSVYEFADRLEDALTAARRALELHPWFRPGVQSVAHVLLRQGRDREALTFLTEANTHLESGLVAAQLAALQTDLGHYTDAQRTLDRYAELSPLLEPELVKWLAARRADSAYFLGDFTTAARHAREVKDKYFDQFAERLQSGVGNQESGARSPEPEDRKPEGGSGSSSLTPGLALRLPLPHLPPAPAVLTVYELLARFWEHPLPGSGDGGAPADGLPDAAERHRAEAGGWVAREFTLELSAAVELISRRVPFVLTLVEAGFSQPRLCIGADAFRGTVTIVDGHDRRPVDAPLGSLVERFGPFGPRCLALLPAAHAAKFNDLPVLADGAARESLYAVQKPLLAHDRNAAEAALRVMRDRFAGSVFTTFAELALARYDAHPVQLLGAYDALLAKYPHESTWVLSKANALRELNRMPERLTLLEVEGSPIDAEPMVAQTLAQALLPLPHRQDEATRLLRRSVQNRPTAAAGYYLLATQWWEERRFDDATELYRFASAMEEREDQFADAYFRAARATEQVPEALRLFQQRAGRAAVPVPAATRSLYHALMDRDEPDQAATAVDQAIRKLQEIEDRSQKTEDRGGSLREAGGVQKSEDRSQRTEEKKTEDKKTEDKRNKTEAGLALGDLLLFRAECRASAGRFEDAEADLAAAKPLVPPVAWHKGSARVARIRPDLASAGAHYLEVIRLDPLSLDAHRTLTVLLADTDGRAAARTHLAQACQRFPHHHPLLKLRAEFLSGDPDADAERALQDMLTNYPDDAWALRQRALVLADRKEHDQALAAVRRAGALEPDHAWYYSVFAQVHKRADRTAEALEALREGLRRNIDQEPMVAELVQLSRGRREKREALAFVAGELRRQPHTGEGLVAYVGTAHHVFQANNGDPDDHTELLETLEQILDERPDLWQAWSVVIQQLAGLGRLEEAHALARDATERFPLLGKLWLDLGQVCHALGNSEGRLDALHQAVAVAPGWSLAARELADALDDADRREDAITVLERATVRNPLDALAHGFLAERLWEIGRSRDALDRAKTAVRLEPGYDWAWHAVQLWAERFDEPDEPAQLTRELARDRAGDPRVWLRLARMLHHPRHNEEVLAALDRAITLEPKNVEAHDLKAERLADMGRFDAALEAANPPQFAGEQRPLILEGREAWVHSRRGDYPAAIRSMSALVKLDQSYVWGWHQLADWYNETGRPEQYLEAAAELVKLQPAHPVGWTMRGEAKIQTGDRDGGKADLREALRISPNYSPAAAILFDAHLADDEFRDAQTALAVLQEHAAGPEVAVKQIQLACRQDDAEGATRSFAEVCEGPGTSGYPIQAALTELRAAGWDDRAHRVLREAWQSGGPFHPWVPIFWIDSPNGQEAEPAERLRAAEAVIKAYPKFVPGHDCKAEQLALAGRYEEALAACKPVEMGEPQPVELRGRAAWIEARRGDRTRAILLMRQLVTEHPNYATGWRHLTAWYDTAGRPRDCLDAAEQFVRFEPNNPLAYVYRGEARRGVADRRGALADFQKAFELDPTFDAAGINLVTEQLAADDVAGAARTLTALQEHANGPVVKLRAVQVACRQGDVEVAVTRFRALTADPDVTRVMLREAILTFDAERWGSRLTDELKAVAFAPGANPDVAGLWAERAVAAGTPDAVSDQLPQLLAQNPAAGREVVLAYVWALAEAGKPVQGTAQKYSELLRADDVAWARTGGALVLAGHYAMASAWMAEWRNRTKVEPWMLRALALAYRMLDQDERAVDVCRAAVKMGGPDEVLADFRAWLALDLALSGQPAEAAAHTAKIDTVTAPDGTRLVLAMAEAVMMVRQAGPDGKSAAFKEAKEHLKTAAAACSPKDVPAGAARAYRRVVSCVAGEAGTLTAKLWAIWQRVAPWVK
jgi:tetratricopeptide (TPR) repeat protein